MLEKIRGGDFSDFKKYLYKRGSRDDSIQKQVLIFREAAYHEGLSAADKINSYVCLLYRLCELGSCLDLENELGSMGHFTDLALREIGCSDNIRKDRMHVYVSLMTAYANSLLYLGKFDHCRSILEDTTAWYEKHDLIHFMRGFYKTCTNLSRIYLVLFGLSYFHSGIVRKDCIDKAIFCIQKGFFIGLGSDDIVAFQEIVSVSKIVDDSTRIYARLVRPPAGEPEVTMLVDKVFVRALRVSDASFKDAIRLNIANYLTHEN
ncbi:hypothetical protein [Billgrantia desiderata]|uniref:hypothetical protein n=1 Tax=Billgrantia desiderata TaxID=52021 RepID=UPI00089E7F12|nr:hypothetical protein [Halomonas desiderata]SEG45231.1 hypothetical protein SAMN04487953_13423 [Halomonas desiderata]